MKNKPNIRKIKEAVLFLLNKASGDLDQYKIAKAIFLADVRHMNKFGRPITYDNYVAMEFGPVPSKTYDFLRHDPGSLNIEVEKRRGTINTYRPLREHDALELSESDETELTVALEAVASSSFDKLRDETHQHIAWQKARENRGNNAPDMDYALLFDEPDRAQAAYIALFSNQSAKDAKQGECTA